MRNIILILIVLMFSICFSKTIIYNNPNTYYIYGLIIYGNANPGYIGIAKWIKVGKDYIKYCDLETGNEEYIYNCKVVAIKPVYSLKQDELFEATEFVRDKVYEEMYRYFKSIGLDPDSLGLKSYGLYEDKSEILEREKKKHLEEVKKAKEEEKKAKILRKKSYDSSLKLYEEKEYEQALEELQEAINTINIIDIDIKPSEEDIYLLNGKILFQLDKYEDAFNNFNKIDPNNIEAKDWKNKTEKKLEDVYLVNGKTLFEQEKFEAALDNFNKLLKINPYNVESENWINKTKERINEKVLENLEMIIKDKEENINKLKNNYKNTGLHLIESAIIPGTGISKNASLIYISGLSGGILLSYFSALKHNSIVKNAGNYEVKEAKFWKNMWFYSITATTILYGINLIHTIKRTHSYNSNILEEIKTIKDEINEKYRKIKELKEPEK